MSLVGPANLLDPDGRRPTGNDRADDRGESLIEVLIALAILSIAGLTIVFGMTLTVKTSDVDRKESTARAAVHDYAEALETSVSAGGYVSGTGSYPAYTAPSGYTATTLTKNCWTGSAWTSCTASNDKGLQQLTLQVASNDNRAAEQLVVVLRKPCAPSQATCT